MLMKRLLYLPCRHHIYELILGATSDELMLPSNGPAITSFTLFCDAWCFIDQTKFKPGTDNARIAKALENQIDEID